MSCNSVIPGQNPNSKQSEDGEVEFKLRGGKSFQTLKPRCWLSPSFTMRVCGKGPSTLEMSYQPFLVLCSVYCPLCREEETKGQGRARAFGVDKGWEKAKAN